MSLDPSEAVFLPRVSSVDWAQRKSWFGRTSGHSSGQMAVMSWAEALARIRTSLRVQHVAPWVQCSHCCHQAASVVVAVVGLEAHAHIVSQGIVMRVTGVSLLVEVGLGHLAEIHKNSVEMETDDC